MDIVAVHIFLAELMSRYRVAIDYEGILETQYRSFLKSDATIIDIGAHEGRHTKVFLEVAPEGQILAVEPLPDKAQILRSTLGPSVRLFQGALGEQEGRAKFVWAQGTPEESGFRERHYNDPQNARPTEIEVEVTTLDQLSRDLRRCDFVKIDVEGAELTALRGGASFLDRLRPIVSVEFGKPAYSVYGHEASDLFHFAKSRRYTLHDIFLNPVPDLDTWLAICDRATWDYFMIPDEQPAKATSPSAQTFHPSLSLLDRIRRRLA